MSPYLKFFWNTVNWMDRTTCKIKMFRPPHQRCTWCFIGAAVVLLAALIFSLLYFGHSSGPKASKCYASGTFDGVTVYLATDHTTMQSCASGSKGSGLTNLPSLPPGLQLVCTGSADLQVYMTPVQYKTVTDLGINPATLCS